MTKQYQTVFNKLYDIIYEQVGRIFPDDVHKSTMTALVTDLSNAAMKRDDFDADERKFFKNKQHIIIPNLVAKFKVK